MLNYINRKVVLPANLIALIRTTWGWGHRTGRVQKFEDNYLLYN